MSRQVPPAESADVPIATCGSAVRPGRVPIASELSPAAIAALWPPAQSFATPPSRRPADDEPELIRRKLERLKGLLDERS
jgi:hypothetical protein